MKKILYYINIFAVVTFLFSCCKPLDKDFVPEDYDISDETEANAALFDGNIADELQILDAEACDGESLASTRSVISDGNFSSWNTGDKISISDGILNYSYKVSKSNGKNCSFEVMDGKKQFTTSGTSKKEYYVFYPSDALIGWYDATATSMIYAEQDYEENKDNGVIGAYMATKGTAENNNGSVHFEFKHIASVIEVNLSTLGTTASSVSLKSNSGVSIAGRMKYNIDDNKISISTSDKTEYATNSQSDVITVRNVPSGASLVRFYILPVLLEKGVTVTVHASDGKYYTKSTSTDIGNATSDVTISGINGATVCTPYYKKVNFGAASTSKRTNNWMACIPGNIKFGLLSTPGAHDAATSTCSGITANASKCQSENISGLLANGVRALDLRPRYTSGNVTDIQLTNLEIYHGTSATGVKFKDAMATIVQFVKDNPSESVSILMQKESSNGTDQSETWRASIRECFSSYSEYLRGWITGNETLSDLRGKIVIVSKNPYGNSNNSYWDVVYGGIVREWPDDGESDNASIYYSWNQGGPAVSASDRYSLTKTNDKISTISNMLNKASADNSNRWYYTFTSMAYSLFGSNPSGYAKTINPQVTSLLNNIEGRLGYVYGDFMGSSSNGGTDLLKTIINQNFKYVYKNRSRYKLHSGTNTGTNVVTDEMADSGQTY